MCSNYPDWLDSLTNQLGVPQNPKMLDLPPALQNVQKRCHFFIDMLGECFVSVFPAHRFLDQESDVLLINEVMKQLTNSASIHFTRPRWPIATD